MGGGAPAPPPIDADRRSRSPGLQHNFYETDISDFKRPWGTGGGSLTPSPPPPPPAATASAGSAAMQFMVTQRMRQRLLQLGYSESEIDSLDPQRAAAILEAAPVEQPDASIPTAAERRAAERRASALTRGQSPSPAEEARQMAADIMRKAAAAKAAAGPAQGQSAPGGPTGREPSRDRAAAAANPSAPQGNPYSANMASELPSLLSRAAELEAITVRKRANALFQQHLSTIDVSADVQPDFGMIRAECLKQAQHEVYSSGGEAIERMRQARRAMIDAASAFAESVDSLDD